MTLRRFFLLLFAVLCLAAPVRAADLGELVRLLGSDDFSEKEQAIQALSALGDGNAAPALRALSEGNLYTTADKKTVIATPSGSGFKLLDPVTQAVLGEATSREIDRVRVNNRLRGAIDSALSQLTLFSPKREDRLNAARDALKHSSAGSVAVLTDALSKEQDSEVREVMQTALFAAQLATGSKDAQIAAVRGLSGSSDPQIRGLLSSLVASPNTAPEVRQAAEAAVSAIEGRLKWIGFAENLFQGISLGSVLLLAAIGLAITFGVMGVINMAHGEMIMLGAYTTFVVQQFFRAYLPSNLIDLYLVAAVPVAFVVAGLIGILLERGVIRFLYGRPLETLLATWGISLALQQIVRLVFGAPNKEVSNPSWMTGGFNVMGGFTITWNRLVIIVFCFIVLGALALILRKTYFGLHMRTVTQNREMASAMGIATARVDALTFGLGSGIAGIAGVALSQIGNVSPNLGTLYIIDSFLVVVFGGVGNLLGTLVGALSLGVVNKLLEPLAGAVLGKIIVLVAIILFIRKRPRGLFALKGRAVEN